MEKLLYRVTEAAEMLGLSRSKVYVLIQAGVLPSVRVDGSRRIRAEDASLEGDLAPLHQLAAPGQVAGLVAGDLRRTLGGGARGVEPAWARRPGDHPSGLRPRHQ